jgi:hypothetical protein
MLRRKINEVLGTQKYGIDIFVAGLLVVLMKETAFNPINAQS